MTILKLPDKQVIWIENYCVNSEDRSTAKIYQTEEGQYLIAFFHFPGCDPDFILRQPSPLKGYLGTSPILIGEENWNNWGNTNKEFKEIFNSILKTKIFPASINVYDYLLALGGYRQVSSFQKEEVFPLQRFKDLLEELE